MLSSGVTATSNSLRRKRRAEPVMAGLITARLVTVRIPFLNVENHPSIYFTTVSATSYHPGGMIVRFSDEPMAMETRSTRKRKAITKTTSNDKENHSESVSTQPACKRTCLTGPAYTFSDTFTAQQSLSERVSSPAQSPHRSPQDNVAVTATLVDGACDLTLPASSAHISSPAQSPSHESPQDNVAATLGGACDLTLPQQAASSLAHTNPYVNSLASLGDESLYTFPPDPLSVFDSNVPMGSVFEAM
jgi:hypothetical protein